MVFKNEFLNYEYAIPGSLSKEQVDLLKGKNYIKKILFQWKHVISNQKKEFLKKVFGILISFLIGCYLMGRKIQVL
ncbi:MAG: hypothetical protein ACTSWY_00540 [Promethearchaeota archaeon]